MVFSARKPLMALCLALLVVAVYGQTGGHPFINIDDHEYVYENRVVLEGLGAEGLSWAFRTSAAGYWHPVTWLSHMTDVTLFGRNPGWHHRVNVLLHLLNTVLLFLVLSGMTGTFWRSGLVAALFAVHPLHVESVAWIAERKDLLCAFFGLLALRAYLGYVRKPGTGRYLLVAAFFALSLMSKPMLVTLPLLLLVLDAWPLARIAWADPSRSPSPPRFPLLAPWRLLLEKAPLAVMSLASGVVTVVAPQGGDYSVSTLANYPLWPRVATAVTGYAWYLRKMAWPVSLSVYHPHPWVVGADIPAWEVAAAFLALAGISLAAFRAARRLPWLAAGWAWYLVCLLPVIGLVQAGLQRVADRYTYLPLIGPFVVIAWGGRELSEKWRLNRSVPAAMAAVLILGLGVLSCRQASFWKDSVTLHSHSLEAEPDNWFLRNVLGSALLDEKRDAEALPQLREALRIRPEFALAHYNLGVLLARNGNPAEAARHYREAVRIDPGNRRALRSLSALAAEMGRPEEAIPALRDAAARDPGDVGVLFDLATLLGKTGRLAESIALYRQVLLRRPDLADARINLGNVLLLHGEIDEAILEYGEVLRRNPADPEALRNTAVALGEKEKARKTRR